MARVVFGEERVRFSVGLSGFGPVWVGRFGLSEGEGLGAHGAACGVFRVGLGVMHLLEGPVEAIGCIKDG